jgi:hypothetical protein
MNSDPTSLVYFAEHGAVTDPGPHAALLDSLPDPLDQLCRSIQGLLIHRNWAEAYGVRLPPERAGDAQARSVDRILDFILELDSRPLAEQRDPLKRFAGTCRDFAVLLCAVLRHRGLPARARCGFGTYFVPGRFEDHWICEHWDSVTERWVQTDAQLDEVQREKLKLDFDSLDMPEDRFVVAGAAWRQCRRGDADPEQFGIFDMHGLWFVRGNVLRDLASLNRVEVLPWDDWGMLLRLGENEGVPEDLQLIDEAARLTADGIESVDAVRAIYERE